MANFNSLKQEIDQNVNTNGQQAITGAILNKTLKDMVDDINDQKQDALIAGQNIQINGNVISATGGGSGQTYQAGWGLDLYGSTFSVDVSDLDGTGLKADAEAGVLEIDPSVVQSKLTPGANIQISGSTISATDTTYSAGSGLSLNGTTFSIDDTVVATQQDLANYQPALSAGSNISISAQNVISATDTTYTAGSGILIDQNNEISADTSVLQPKLTAGSGISISAQNVISATGGGGGGTTYGDGDAIHIDSNDNINVLYGNGLQLDGNGALEVDPFGMPFLPLAGGQLQDDPNNTNSTDLNITSPSSYAHIDVYTEDGPENPVDSTAYIEVQDSNGTAVYGSDGITVNGDKLSFPGGTGSATLATTDDLGMYLPLEGGDLQANSAQNNTTLRILDPDAYYSNVIIDANKSGDAIVQINTTSGTTEYRHGEIMSGSDTYTFPSSSGTIALTSDIPSYSAGSNIQINGTTISATDTTYSAGSNVSISAQNVISATDTTYSAGDGIGIDGNNEISIKAGTGLGFDANGYLVNTGGGGSYVAGNGIDITSGTISVDETYLDGVYLPLEGGILQKDAQQTNTILTVKSPDNNEYIWLNAANSAGTGITLGFNSTNPQAGDVRDVSIYEDRIDIMRRDSQNVWQADSLYYPSFKTGTIALTSDLSGKQDSLTASNGISIDAGNNISAKLGSGLQFDQNGAIETTGGGGTSYSAGNGIDITSGTISVDASDLDGNGLSVDQNGALEVDTTVIQEKLTAGTGITITGSTISATGGGGTGLWSSGTGTNSLISPAGDAGTATASGTGAISMGSSSQASGNYSIASGSATASGDHAIALGAGTANGYYSVMLGTMATVGVGDKSVALNATAANAHYSIAGPNADASGTNATYGNVAFGYGATASPQSYTTAIGHGAKAIYEGTTAIGNYNECYDQYSSSASLLAIGNGTADNARSNALEIRKSDNAAFLNGVGGYTGNSRAAGVKSLQTVINGKQDTLVSGTNIKTVNGSSILGSGDISTAGPIISGTGTGAAVSASGASYTGGDYAFAFGTNAGATGNYSLGFGTNAGAFAVGSVAIGDTVYVSGNNSVGIGKNLTVGNNYEVALGYGAKTTSSGTNADKTLFTIGNRDVIGDAGNAFEIKRNNDIYVVGVGGYDGTNAGASGVETLQDAINNGGGGGTSYTAGNGIDITSGTISVDETYLDSVYLPIIGGSLENTQNHTDLRVDAPNSESDNFIDILSPGTGVPSVELGTDTNTQGDVESFKIKGDATIDIKYVGDNTIYNLSFPTLSQDDTLATLSDIQGGGGSYLPLEGGTLQDDPNSASDTTLVISNPANSADITLVAETIPDPNDPNTDINVVHIDLTDTNGSVSIKSDGVSDGTYTCAWPTLSQDTTFATLDDIQSGGGLWSSGSGTDSLLSPGAANSGQGADASGTGAISVGYDTTAQGDYSFSHGASSSADGDYSFAANNGAAAGDYAAAFNTSGADGDYSFAAGYGSTASAAYSVALAGGTTVYDDSDPNDVIDAQYGVAIGDGSTVEGEYGLAFMGGTASGSHSVAIGDSASAVEMYSTALTGSSANGNYSFAASTGAANGHYSTAFSGSFATGEGSLASGFTTNAFGYCSAALGYSLSTYDQADGTDSTDPNAGEVALGRYNYSEAGIVFTVGCGYYDSEGDQDVRENAVAIDSDGKIYLKGLGGYTGQSVSGCTDLVSFLNSL